jgi:hypothetical protein
MATRVGRGEFAWVDLYRLPLGAGGPPSVRWSGRLYEAIAAHRQHREARDQLPLSATVEVAATRAVLRRLLSSRGEPYLVLRLGVADPDHAEPPRTPRLPAEQTTRRG